MVTPVLDSQQQAVVQTVLSRRTGHLAISGAAGTGKTTLVRALVSALGKRAILSAPTGKACARLTEVTGSPAHTLHSLMMQPTFMEASDRGLYDPIRSAQGKMAFKSKGAGLRAGQVLIVDEASMVTRALCSELVNFSRSGLLVLVGDANQLPPVAEGNFSVFSEDGLEVLTLNRVYRQGEGSLVLDAAHRLLDNHKAGNPRPLEALSDLPQVDQYDLLETMRRGFVDHGPEEFAVLTYKNAARDEITSAYRAHVGYASGTLVEGEPLVITRNSPKHGVYNGDICIFLGWTDSGESYSLGDAELKIRGARLETLRGRKTINAVLLLTSGNLSVADKKKLDKDFGRDTLVLMAEYAYCLTGHKSQGSQWNHVLIAYDEMWSNNLEQKYKWSYTALTRASVSCSICELHRSSPLSFKKPKPYTAEQLAASPLLARLVAAKAGAR